MKSHRTPWFKQILLQATFSPARIPKLGWLVLVGLPLFLQPFEDGVLFPIPKDRKLISDFKPPPTHSEALFHAKMIIASSLSEGDIHISTDIEFTEPSVCLTLDCSPEIEAENHPSFHQRQETSELNDFRDKPGRKSALDDQHDPFRRYRCWGVQRFDSRISSHAELQFF